MGYSGQTFGSFTQNHPEPLAINSVSQHALHRAGWGLGQLILEVNKEQNLGARRLEKIIDFTHGKHIPHNAIYKVLIAHGRAKTNPNKSKRRKTWVGENGIIA